MPINLPQDIYTGGAERFNPQQGVNLYAQLMARKQARDDAFGEYVRNLNKTINPAGLRNQERPIFDKKYSDWQKYGMDNWDDIQKRRNGADMKFYQMYQDILNVVAESKGEEEKKKPAIEILLDPNKRDRLRIPKENMEEELLDPTLTTQLHLHDQPLYIMKPDGSIERNYNRRPLDYSSVEFNPKPFEQDKYFKQFEDIKKSDLPPVVVKDPKTLTQSVTTTSVFKPEDKEIIYTRAAMDYIQNPAFREALRGVKPEQYNGFFKENYGRNIETPEDLAAAFTLKGIQQKTIKSEYKDDTFEKQKIMEGIRQGNKERNLKLASNLVLAREEFKATKNAKIIKKHIEKQYNDPDAESVDVEYKGKKYYGKIIKGVDELTDENAINEGTKDQPIMNPPLWVLTDDKKHVLRVYNTGQKNKDGRFILRTESKPLDIEDYEVQLSNKWLKSTRTANEIASSLDENDEDNDYGDVNSGSSTNIIRSSNKSQQSIPTGTMAEWLSTPGWTKEKINQAVKEGKIKLK